MKIKLVKGDVYEFGEREVCTSIGNLRKHYKQLEKVLFNYTDEVEIELSDIAMLDSIKYYKLLLGKQIVVNSNEDVLPYCDENYIFIPKNLERSLGVSSKHNKTYVRVRDIEEPHTKRFVTSLVRLGLVTDLDFEYMYVVEHIKQFSEFVRELNSFDSEFKACNIVNEAGRHFKFSREESETLDLLDLNLCVKNRILNFSNVDHTNHYNTFSFFEIMHANKTMDKVIEGANRLKSPLEKYLYIYEYVVNKVYKPEGKTDDESESREFVKVINGEKIVCAGYSALLSVLCNAVGIKCESILASVSTANERNYHMMNRVYLKDELYGVSGVFFSNPTIDSMTHNRVKTHSVINALVSDNDMKHFVPYEYEYKTVFRSYQDFHNEDFPIDFCYNAVNIPYERVEVNAEIEYGTLQMALTQAYKVMYDKKSTAKINDMVKNVLALSLNYAEDYFDLSKCTGFASQICKNYNEKE